MQKSNNPDFVDINEFDYPLAEEKIPAQPLEVRHNSKLLVYKSREIQDSVFLNISDFLPSNACIVANNTKVFPARLIFKKTTGAAIEIFCLEPIPEATPQPNRVVWRVLVGNLKRWKSDTLVLNHLKATLLQKETDTCLVAFEWEGKHTFYEILDAFAELPLPPYMKRKATQADKERYQTVYAQHTGSVAAPTAGLHFTNDVFNRLSEKGIEHHYLTLHVGAGTFKPVTEKNALLHLMHSEQFTISKKLIDKILQGSPIVAVGTTSMRVLETLYGLGVKSHLQKQLCTQWNQADSVFLQSELTLEQALQTLLQYMTAQSLDTLSGSTQIYITPGFQFRICKGLITNFHQPKSTLILLVSAFIGSHWRKVYNHALNNHYRFLSYGDSSLLMP